MSLADRPLESSPTPVAPGAPPTDDAALWELVNGRRLEKEMGTLSTWIAFRLAFLLQVSLADRPGWVLTEPTFQCFPFDPPRVRRPDVALILPGRLPGELLPTGHCPVAPDLVAEVVSYHDNAYTLTDRLEDFLRIGVPLVWQVNPNARSVIVFRGGSTQAELLHENDTLRAEPVLPDFACRVGEIFPAGRPAAAGS